MSELKDRIEYVLGKKLAGEPVAQTIGLKVEFEKQVNLVSGLPKYRDETNGSFVYLGEDICDLVDEQDVIVFSNAIVSGTPNAQLSGRSNDGLKVQDVFHFDPYNVVSLIHKPSNFKREVATDYTYIDEVKKAVCLLNADFSDGAVAAALKTMSSPEYIFSLEEKERAVRKTIQGLMPEFNQIIFDLIPADRKLRHEWTSAQNEVVAHSNKKNHILHGRRQWHGGKNCLIGMDITR